MEEYDLYDVLAELGYGLEPKTRRRAADAFDYKAADWLGSLPGPTAATLRALARQFARAGTEELENPGVLSDAGGRRCRRAGGAEAARQRSGDPPSDEGKAVRGMKTGALRDVLVPRNDIIHPRDDPSGEGHLRRS